MTYKGKARQGCPPGRASGNQEIAFDALDDATALQARQSQFVIRRCFLPAARARIVAEHAFDTRRAA